MDNKTMLKRGAVIESYIEFLAFNGRSEFDMDGQLLKEFYEDFVIDQNFCPNMTSILKDHVSILKVVCETMYESKVREIDGSDQQEYAELHDGGDMKYFEDVGYFAQELGKISEKNSQRDVFFVSEQARFLQDNLQEILIHQYNLTGSTDDLARETALNGIIELLLSISCLMRGESKRGLNLVDLSYKNETYIPWGLVPFLFLTVKKNHCKSADDPPKRAAATRNKNPLLCLVTAVAFSLWYTFDMPQGRLSGRSRPDFYDPDELNNIKLLYSANTNMKTTISPGDMNDLALSNLEAADFEAAYPKNHSGRTVEGYHADADRISLDHFAMNSLCDDTDQKKGSNAFRFALQVARFDERKYVPVPHRDPPELLTRQIFPWIEDTKKSREQYRKAAGTSVKSNKEADNFFELLVSLRPVILQSLVTMTDLVPQSIFAQHPIAKSRDFLKYKVYVDDPHHYFSVEATGGTLALEAPFDSRMARELQDIRSEVEKASESAEGKLDRLFDEVKQIVANDRSEMSYKMVDLRTVIGGYLFDSSSRLDRMESKMGDMEAKLNKMGTDIEAKLNKMDAKMEAKLDKIDAKTEAKLDKLDAKMKSMDAKIDTKMDRLDSKFNMLIGALKHGKSQ